MGIRLVLQTSIMIYFLAARNPMCSVFPTVTSCNIPNVGAAGGEQMHNGLCVLTQVRLHCIAGVLFTCLAPEHHQREDLPRTLVLVCLPWTLVCTLCLLQALHYFLQWYPLQSALQNSKYPTCYLCTWCTWNVRCGASMMMIFAKAWTMCWPKVILVTGLFSISYLRIATLTSTESLSGSWQES